MLTKYQITIRVTDTVQTLSLKRVNDVCRGSRSLLYQTIQSHVSYLYRRILFETLVNHMLMQIKTKRFFKSSIYSLAASDT
jgi:hypothetical protein